MFNQAMFRDENEEYAAIFVGDPRKEGDAVSYLVKAFDNQGYFEIRRRMRDFYALRDTLQKRLPGVFLPSLPPKTLTRSSDQQFLEERSFHLEQFMKKVHKLFYLKESDELAVFGRYKAPEDPTQPDFLKKLEQLPKQNAAMLAFRIKCACTGIDVSSLIVYLLCRINSASEILRGCRARLAMPRSS